MRTSKTLSRVIAVFGLVVLAVAAWLALGRLRPRADWVHVWGPRFVLPGQPLNLRLDVGSVERSAWLTVGLHGGATSRAPGRYVASAGSLPLAPASGEDGGAAGSYVFAFQLQSTDDLRYVVAVIYLSETGDWADRFRVAVTERVPVHISGNVPHRRVSWEAYCMEVGPGSLPAPTASAGGAPPTEAGGGLARPILALASPAGAGLCAGCAARNRQDRHLNGKGRPGAFGWAALAALLALAAVWQYFGLGELAITALRGVAEEHGLYHMREAAQRAGIAGTLAGLAALVLLIVRRPISPLTIASLSAMLMGAVLLVHAVSFHYADILERVAILRVSLPEVVNGAGLLTVLVGAAAGLAAKS